MLPGAISGSIRRRCPWKSFTPNTGGLAPFRFYFAIFICHFSITNSIVAEQREMILSLPGSPEVGMALDTLPGEWHW